TARDRGWGLDITELGSMRFHADHRGIVQAMVSAFKFHDLVAASRSAGQSHAVHSGFSSAVAETHHFYWETIADFLCQLPFHVMRHAKHGPGSQASPDGLHHSWMTVPGHQGAKAEVVIEVVVAVEIAEVRT